MLNYFKKIRHSSRPTRGYVEDDGQCLFPPVLPPNFPYDPSEDEQWRFEDGRVIFNGEDVETYVNGHGNDTRVLLGLTQGLHRYRHFVWERGGKTHAAFNGSVEALQNKIVMRLGTLYDGITSGLHIEMANGRLWLNNIDVRKVITYYHLKPTQKVHRYLMGLRDKLGLILSRRSDSHGKDGITDEVWRLFQELTTFVERAPGDTPCLPASSRAA